MSRKRLPFGPLCALLLVAYAGSYVILSRYSMLLVREEGYTCFFYAPTTVSNLVSAPAWQEFHAACSKIYFPIWWLDHKCGGPAFGYIPLASVRPNGGSPQ